MANVRCAKGDQASLGLTGAGSLSCGLGWLNQARLGFLHNLEQVQTVQSDYANLEGTVVGQMFLEQCGNSVELAGRSDVLACKTVDSEVSGTKRINSNK